MQTLSHCSVMRAEALEGLLVQPAGKYIDATFGRGGHAADILQRLGQSGRLLILDQDPEAIAAAHNNPIFEEDPRVVIQWGSFSELSRYVLKSGWDQVQGILLDLGVSSPQLEDPKRGFSFKQVGPLDMRMNPVDNRQTAAQWLNKASAVDIANVLYKYGQERYSRRIAGAIVEHRAKQPLVTTDQLSELVQKAVPRFQVGDKHSATRTFQAIRIFINQELEVLEKGLEESLDLLAPKGRLVVITFHSLEEKVVKKFVQSYTSGNEIILDRTKKAPSLPKLKRIGKAIRVSVDERHHNPRARSARLRIIEKVE